MPARVPAQLTEEGARVLPRAAATCVSEPRSECEQAGCRRQYTGRYETLLYSDGRGDRQGSTKEPNAAGDLGYRRGRRRSAQRALLKSPRGLPQLFKSGMCFSSFARPTGQDGPTRHSKLIPGMEFCNGITNFILRTNGVVLQGARAASSALPARMVAADRRICPPWPFTASSAIRVLELKLWNELPIHT